MALSDLITSVAATSKLDNKTARLALDAVFKAIEDALIKGESVRITFGTFSVAEREARKGRNLRTGETIDIPASKTVKFKPSKAVKDRLNPTSGKKAAAGKDKGMRKKKGA
jgi:DNA-binding protein HU-beta